MWFTSGDPLTDFRNWDAEQTAWLEKRPKCAECGEPIQDEECWEIEGKLICSDCLESNHKHWTEDYIG